MTPDGKKAVLFVAFGGADSIENIEPFIKNVLKGRLITQQMLEKTKERYKLIGGKSPLLGITLAQAKAVEALLAKEGLQYKTYVGMRHWHPYIKEAVEEMHKDGITDAVALIMSPFSSPVATGGYNLDVENAARPYSNFRINFIEDWHINPLFIDALVENINAELKAFGNIKDALVIYSSHSLPMAALEGDAYEMKIKQTVEILSRKIPADYRVGYQSQGGGPSAWLGPRTEDIIKEAAKLGKKGVVIVPLSFVADHVETLYDIDILFKDTAKSMGLVFRRSASLNTSPRFMGLFADLVKKYGGRQW